jgi:hypothetical protein
MACVLGFSDEPVLTSYLHVHEKEATQIFSICQDVINAFSQGRTQTPKALSLAMAVRQISGCSGLINILHGLGYCVSLSSTMAYDSALAQLTINTSNIVPKEFIPGKHINLVYDNIDFQEESDEQTHVTNGIIIQKTVPGTLYSVERPSECATIKKKQRSIEVPASTITPYVIGIKKTPTFDRSALDLASMEPHIKNNEIATAQKLDLAYSVIKIFAANDEEPCPPWPGWIGFNTMLRQSDIPPVSRVDYLPIVDASPTEYSTLNEVLKSGIRILDKLQLQQTVFVFDEGLYSKIKHI